MFFFYGNKKEIYYDGLFFIGIQNENKSKLSIIKVDIKIYYIDHEIQILLTIFTLKWKSK